MLFITRKNIYAENKHLVILKLFLKKLCSAIFYNILSINLINKPYYSTTKLRIDL